MIEDYISEVVSEYFKKQDKLTKEQFGDCLMEAISSGDFMIHCERVRIDHFKHPLQTLNGSDEIVMSNKQGMSYIPYREKNRLENEVEELKKENAKLREGLEFYGDVNNWIVDHWDGLPVLINKEQLNGGKLARQILSEVDCD